jgi:hypothetical protein
VLHYLLLKSLYQILDTLPLQADLLMIKQKSLIGMELDCSLHTVEANQLNRLNLVFNSANPLGSNKGVEPSKVDLYHYLPPFLLGNLINMAAVYKTLGLNINNVLLSRESIICHHLFKAGDSISIRTFLKDAYEQQASSNPIGFVILESVGMHKDDLAFYVERVIAVRGGFQRGRA